MKMAVLSDIHANYAALEAVFEQVDKQGVDCVVCLGDLVGYNAEPQESMALIQRRAHVVVAGNHDRDVLRESSLGTQSAARFAQRWTASVLNQAERDYLRALPSHHLSLHGYVAAHGAYLSEVYVSGYVTSTMLEENLQAIHRRASFPGLAFCGHTHVPMLGAWDGIVTEEYALREPVVWSPDAKVVLINPGAVGQPRDGDPRASFALVDTEARSCALQRVAYDLDRTLRVMERERFPEELMARLKEGR